VVAQELVADPVQLVGGHSRFDVRADELTGLGGEAAGDAHLRDGLGVLDLAAGEAFWSRLVDVLRTGDVGGHLAARGHGGSGNGSHVNECSFRDMSSYWYCVKHKTVESGVNICPPIDRLGPFDTQEEAEQALEKAQERNEEWDNDPKWNDKGLED
jgi:hypothetical protein